MKENKVNVDLIVPNVGKRYNLFIPANKTVGEVIVILNNSINEMTGCFPKDNKLVLLNVTDNVIYNNTDEVKSVIKNGSILALF